VQHEWSRNDLMECRCDLFVVLWIKTMSDLLLATFEIVCCEQMLTFPFGINPSGLWLFNVDESMKILIHTPSHYQTLRDCQNLWSWWLIILMWHAKNPKAKTHTLENLIGWKHTTLSIKCVTRKILGFVIGHVIKYNQLKWKKSQHYNVIYNIITLYEFHG